MSNIKIFSAYTWGQKAAELIVENIQQVVSRKGRCSVMLTGGRAGAQLYEEWRNLPAYSELFSSVDFYFGDERCVPLDHPESNYRLVVDGLFENSLPRVSSIQRMEADFEDVEEAADRYAELLPKRVDILLLGVGEDGHIASLFPNHNALAERKRQVVPVMGPKPPACRLTITVPVIERARQVYVLAPGQAKAAVYERAVRDPDDFEALPARLVLGANWLLDRKVY